MYPKMYGIYNNDKGHFEFRICGRTPEEVKKKLYNIIGNNAYDAKYEARIIPAPKMVKYGIYNTTKECYQFKICEDTAEKAVKRLAEIIGEDAHNPKFEPRKLPAFVIRAKERDMAKENAGKNKTAVKSKKPTVEHKTKQYGNKRVEKRPAEKFLVGGKPTLNLIGRFMGMNYR